MKINFKNTDLKILINNKEYDFFLEKELNIKKIRNKYNNLISKISLNNHDKIEYWSNNISERNPITTTHFLDYCYIHLIKKHQKKNIEVLTNKLAIFYYFKNNSNIGILSKIIFNIKFFYEKILNLRKVLFFLLLNIYIHLFYCSKKYKKNLNNSVIIQTWVSDFNFNNSNFFDLYNFNLKKKLEKKINKKIYTWLIFNKVKKLKKIFNSIRSKNNNFLYIGDYLSILDYFKAILFYEKSKKIKIEIKQKNLREVFNYYNLTSSINYSILFFYFIKKTEKFKNINYLCHHENNIPEKILISAIRKLNLKSKIIGFFHSTKPRNLLFLDYANFKEYLVTPKPDKIIFNSNFYKNFYKKKYNNEIYSNGFALKQNHLLKRKKRNIKGKKYVLVLFTGDNFEIRLILDFLNSKKFKNFNFLFRMHPMNNFELKKFYFFNNYKIVNDKKIDELVKYNITKVITGYSGMAVEFQQKKFEIGLLADKKKVFLNPFDDLNILDYKILYSSEDLLKFLCHKRIEHRKGKREKIFNLKETDFNSFYKYLK